MEGKKMRKKMKNVDEEEEEEEEKEDEEEDSSSKAHWAQVQVTLICYIPCLHFLCILHQI